MKPYKFHNNIIDLDLVVSVKIFKRVSNTYTEHYIKFIMNCENIKVIEWSFDSLEAAENILFDIYASMKEK